MTFSRSCPYCSYRTEKQSTLSMHIAMKHDTEYRPHQCPHCDKSFRVRTQLHHHVTNHHLSKKIKCKFPDCTNTFKHPTTAKVHFVRSHMQCASYFRELDTAGKTKMVECLGCSKVCTKAAIYYHLAQCVLGDMIFPSMPAPPDTEICHPVGYKRRRIYYSTVDDDDVLKSEADTDVDDDDDEDAAADDDDAAATADDDDVDDADDEDDDDDAENDDDDDDTDTCSNKHVDEAPEACIECVDSDSEESPIVPDDIFTLPMPMPVDDKVRDEQHSKDSEDLLEMFPDMFPETLSDDDLGCSGLNVLADICDDRDFVASSSKRRRGENVPLCSLATLGR